MPAGSKPGEHRGGRAKGQRNHASIAREKEVAASGPTPLDGLLFVYRHYLDEARVLLSKPKPNKALVNAALENVKNSAKEAAPYTHPKLAALAAMRAPDPTQTTLEQMLLALDALEPANSNALLLEGTVDKVDAAE